MESKRLWVRSESKTVRGVEMQKCTRCGNWLPVDAFELRSAGSDDHHTQCKTCRKVKRQASTIEDLRNQIANYETAQEIIDVAHGLIKSASKMMRS